MKAQRTTTLRKKPETKLPFKTHLLEIRTRLVWSLLSIGGGSVMGYYLYPQILDLLLKPSQGPLFYTSPAGGLDFRLKISLFCGLLFALPILMLQLIRFIEPALPEKSLLPVGKFFIASVILMLFGMSFAYFISLPAALHFLAQFSSEQIQALISTDAYFAFVTRYILGFGVIFQFPLLLLLVNYFSPLKMANLFAYQKWVILISFVLAGVITPTPDIFNQLMMALPIIGLYQLSILVIYITNKHLTHQDLN